MPCSVAGAREENKQVSRQSTGQGLFPFLKEEPQIWRVSMHWHKCLIWHVTAHGLVPDSQCALRCCPELC